MLPDRLKLGINFCPKRLQADLNRISSAAWINNFVTQNYEGDSKILPLRAAEGAVHPVMMVYSDPSCDRFENTRYLKECPYFKSVIETFPFEFHSVRLMALCPGARIKEHSDHDLALEYGAIRMHIPIVTNDEVEFFLNNSSVSMREGECWYLRLSDPHRACNPGGENRVHLVLDAPAGPAVSNFLHRHSHQNHSEFP